MHFWWWRFAGSNATINLTHLWWLKNDAPLDFFPVTPSVRRRSSQIRSNRAVVYKKWRCGWWENGPASLPMAMTCCSFFCVLKTACGSDSSSYYQVRAENNRRFENRRALCPSRRIRQHIRSHGLKCWRIISWTTVIYFIIRKRVIWILPTFYY